MLARSAHSKARLTLPIWLPYNLEIRTAESSGWSWVELRVKQVAIPVAKMRVEAAARGWNV
jgi:hypothetical protein